MTANAQLRPDAPETAVGYQSVLLALDSSDHANRGISESALIADAYGAEVTGVHVYAAAMHDLRFRQMEGGLPQQFREEQELERQRVVHDDLITRGLSIITDSYLDYAGRIFAEKDMEFRRRSLEGKNYRELVTEANCGRYDLLVMGALGVGAVDGARLGSVCQRVVRRSGIDTLVIKQPDRSLSEGPVLVAVDGSPRSYGGLLSALSLARAWQVPVHVVAAFDPYYHYVAFNRIAGVLSAEASRVFRFQEQEKLHEEIIDSGLAKIYQGHLEIARSIAEERGQAIETRLLDGKPDDAIRKYAESSGASLLVMGKLGIHADDGLDIGGNAENLLREVPCAVLLSQRQHRPEVEAVAAVTTSWTTEAEARMALVPSFARDMARMAILRHAQQRGHTVVTEAMVDEVTARMCPHAERAMRDLVQAHERSRGPEPMTWSDAARKVLDSVTDPAVRANLSMRAEKKARQDGDSTVGESHVLPFVPQPAAEAPRPQAETGRASGCPFHNRHRGPLVR